MNHYGTHKCSSYCLVITIIKVLYNIINHKHVKDADIVTENYKRYTKLNISKCRMYYGKSRIFHSSGENNLTLTGCAISLINGTAHHQSFNIPT